MSALVNLWREKKGRGKESKLDDWSITKSKLINVSYKWTIADFLLHCQKPGSRISSGEFGMSLTGSSWCVELYPRGEGQGSRDFISIYLRHSQGPTLSVANLTISLLNEKNKVVASKSGKLDSLRLSSPSTRMWGWAEFVKRAEVETRKRGLLCQGKDLIITLEFTAVRDWITLSSSNLSIDPTDSGDHSPLENYEHLYLNEVLSDCALLVEGEELPCHRFLLVSRSPVFNAMFSHDTKESQEGRVEVSGIQPMVFRKFLRFLYTGLDPDPVDETEAEELLVVADRYQVNALKSFCVLHLSSHLALHNVSHTLRIANKYNAESLKNQAESLVLTSATLMSEDEWTKLAEETPREVLVSLLSKALGR